MAGIPDKDLQTQASFPAGVNNVAPLTRPPRDQDGNITVLRSALDVDLDATGRPRMRRGQTTRVAESSHSLFATTDYLFANVAGNLRAYTDDGAGLADAGAIVSGLGDRFITYASDDLDTYWSNNVTNGRIDADLGVHPFWLATPDPVTLAATSNGGLAAGSYEVSVTVLDADGRESGASAPVVIAVTAGQGITCTLPTAPTDATAWRVYRTTADGDVLYRCADLPITATSTPLAYATLGEPLETAWLFPLLPVHTLRYGHGRLVGLTSGSVVWSEPHRLGLMADANHLGLLDGRMLEPVGEGSDAPGWFASDFKRTYFFAGADPDKWQQRIVYGHPAVPGTSMTLPGSVFGLQDVSQVALWLSGNGVWCLGLPGGIVQPIREGELAMQVDAERGASGYFEFDGIRQLITSMLGGVTSGLNVAASDSASATVRRNGITL
jgi:hypothetical protein